MIDSKGASVPVCKQFPSFYANTSQADSEEEVSCWSYSLSSLCLASLLSCSLCRVLMSLVVMQEQAAVQEKRPSRGKRGTGCVGGAVHEGSQIETDTQAKEQRVVATDKKSKEGETKKLKADMVIYLYASLVFSDIIGGRTGMFMLYLDFCVWWGHGQVDRDVGWVVMFVALGESLFCIFLISLFVVSVGSTSSMYQGRSREEHERCTRRATG